MLNCILFYDDNQRWWQPGNYLTKVMDSNFNINVYNHGVIAEDIGVLETLDSIKPKIDFILVVDSGKTHHKLHHHTETIVRNNVKTAIWLSDTHIGWEDRKFWITEFRYDYVFVAQKDAVSRVTDECAYSKDQVFWLPHAVDIDIFKLLNNPKKKYDAVSVGFMNQNREKIFPILESQINFKQFSTIWGWSVGKAYQEAKMGINIPVANDPLNMRCFEIGACKVPQIIGYPDNDSNGLFELFADEEDILTFPLSDISKLKELVVRLLVNPQISEKLAENMYNKVVNQHTYKHRLNTILETMSFEERF